jgi:predicted ester cyclase
VAVRYTGRGTHAGAFMGIPPTGKQVTFTGIDLFRIAHGRLAEEWLMFDQLGLLRQLGAVPTQG